MRLMADAYEVWLDQVRDALRSIDMSMEDWQKIWAFDFAAEHKSGTTPDAAAMKANRFWWREQNKSIGRGCDKILGCWLPRGHQGECQPTFERGDYIKVEFPDETTGIGEWMWMIVDHCDDEKRVVYGVLDSDPVNQYGRKVKLGSQLAISYDNIRDHKKPTEFTKQ